MIAADSLVLGIEQYDAAIAGLEKQRSILASGLERAADAAYRSGFRDVANGHLNSKCCTGGYFNYSGRTEERFLKQYFAGTLFEDEPEPHIHFSYDCSFHGEGQGAIDVPISFINRFLTASQESS